MRTHQVEGKPEEFLDRDLSGARSVRTGLSDAVMRAVYGAGADIDAPWPGLIASRVLPAPVKSVRGA